MKYLKNSFLGLLVIFPILSMSTGPDFPELLNMANNSGNPEQRRLAIKVLVTFINNKNTSFYQDIINSVMHNFSALNPETKQIVLDKLAQNPVEITIDTMRILNRIRQQDKVPEIRKKTSQILLTIERLQCVSTFH